MKNYGKLLTSLGGHVILVLIMWWRGIPLIDLGIMSGVLAVTTGGVYQIPNVDQWKDKGKELIERGARLLGDTREAASQVLDELLAERAGKEGNSEDKEETA